MEYTENIGSDNQQSIGNQTFIKQSLKGKNEWWRYLLTFMATLIGWQVVGVLPIIALAAAKSENYTDFMHAAQDNFMSMGIDKNIYLTAMIFMFLLGLLFLVWAVKIIHRRSVLSVITSRNTFDWQRFFFGFALWFLLGVLLIFSDYALHPEDFVWNFNPTRFTILLLISLVLMPFQTSFEEIFIRGYLMQGFGILAKNRWLPLLLTSLIFGVLHGANPEVAKIGSLLLIYYILTGLLFGMITLLDEGLEIPLGLHAANNIVAALFVTTNWTVFQTDALLIDTSEPNLSMLMYVPLLIIYPLALWVLTKKYDWKDWQKKLLGAL
jgi:membrane protease YdiL (CAAX protease family)